MSLVEICMMCDNYTTDDAKYRAGRKGIADKWAAMHIDEIVDNTPEKEFEDIETACSRFVEIYNPQSVPHASEELSVKTQCKLVQKVGVVLRQKKKRETWRDELAEYEKKLREKFTNTLLPPPAFKQQNGQSAAGSQKAVSSNIEESPALKFDEHGRVQTDMSCKARSKGLVVGSACFAVKHV